MNLELRKNFRFLITPFLVLFMLTVITIIGAKIILGQLTDINSQIAELTHTQELLNSKLSTLRINTQTASDLSSKVTIALPSQNPSFLVLSVVRSTASLMSIPVTNISVGQETDTTDGALKYTPITFTVEADPIKISNFLVGLSKFAPLTKLEEIKFTNFTSGNNFLGTVTLNTYWSNFPAKLPSLTEPIVDLTVDEKKILGDLSSLQEASITTGVNIPVSTISAGPRANPFSR